MESCKAGISQSEIIPSGDDFLQLNMFVKKIKHDPVRDRTVMHYVYVLKSDKSGRLYTGITNNLRKRLKEHNSGKSYWTKREQIWKLIYNEASLHNEDARSRELYLKSGMGKRYLKNRLKRFLSLTG